MKKLHRNVSSLDLRAIGKPKYQWKTFDYYPHQRGMLWYLIAGIISIGIIIAFFFLNDDFLNRWLSIGSFLVGIIVYAFIHRENLATHDLYLFSKGVAIDKNWYEWKQFTGFWFIIDNGVSVVNLELIIKEKKTKTLTLQLANEDPEELQNILEEMGLQILPDEKETITNLWLRILKL